MIRSLLTSSAAIAALCLAAPDGTGSGAAAGEDSAKSSKPEKPEKPAKAAVIKQNGIKRPEAGSVTGRLWDIADHISAQQNRPAGRKQVVDEYMKVPGANAATANTQYARWVAFHGVGDLLKANRKAEQVEAKKAREAEKATKKADAEAKKAEKDAAKAAPKSSEKPKADADKNKAAA